MENETKRQYKSHRFSASSGLDYLTALILKGFEKMGSWVVFGKLYNYIFYRKMIFKEIAAAELKPGAKVLHVGSGPLPLTSICLADSGFVVDAIDNDSAVVCTAIKTTKKFALDKTIKFKETDGTEINCLKYDAVWISFIVQPKEEVIKKVLSTLKDGGKVIYRNPRSWLTLFYPQANPRELASLHHYIKVNQILGKESVIITKKPGYIK